MTTTLLPLRAYLARKRADNAPGLALGYHDGHGNIVAWEFAWNLPWYGVRLEAHERWHVDQKAEVHSPWYAFRVECGHALRLRDPAGLLTRVVRP